MGFHWSKNVDLAKVFNVLGVAFDLNVNPLINPLSAFVIKNAEARVSDLVERINAVLKEVLHHRKGSKEPEEQAELCQFTVVRKDFSINPSTFGRYEGFTAKPWMRGMPKEMNFSDDEPFSMSFRRLSGR